MSNKQTPLPDVQTAYNVMTNIGNRVFFSKCAAAGYEPRTEQEALSMLEMAAKLRLVDEQNGVKQAAAQESPFAVMNSDLDRAMSAQGFTTNRDVASGRRDVAVKIAQENNVYNAVLVLRANQAATIDREFSAKA